jgi:hypothetical protein
MFKSLIIGTALSAAFLAGGRVHYSALQIQTPMGSAVKVTPDPSNIWSFHETYTITASGKHSIPVVVDFDKNGRMDTELDQVRVLITDVSIKRGTIASNYSGDLKDLALKSDDGPIWIPSFAGWHRRQDSNLFHYADHLSTPLALPVGSKLSVQFEAVLLSGAQYHNEVHIHIIGRLVTL